MAIACSRGSTCTASGNGDSADAGSTCCTLCPLGKTPSGPLKRIVGGHVGERTVENGISTRFLSNLAFRPYLAFPGLPGPWEKEGLDESCQLFYYRPQFLMKSPGFFFRKAESNMRRCGGLTGSPGRARTKTRSTGGP